MASRPTNPIFPTAPDRSDLPGLSEGPAALFRVGVDRKRLSGPALRAFFRIAALWGLSADQQMTLLGLSARSTFFKWKRHADIALPRDTLERISYILGIYKALQILLPDERAADEWVRRPNAAPMFGGRPALDRMLSGQVADLFIVRQYLDAERGGWA